MKSFHKLFFSLRKNFTLIIVFFGTLFFVCFPLYQDGFFPTFDDVQVVRIEQMVKELKGGQFPVRYVGELGNGGGYMLFQMYPPLAYYLGALINIIGFTSVQATKLTFIISYFIGALGILILLKNFVGRFSICVGVLLYLTAPFLNYEVYTKGSLSEFMAFNLIPFYIWCLFQLFYIKRTIFVLISGVMLSLIIYTHSFAAFAALLLLLLFLISPKYYKNKIVYFFMVIVVGVGLSASFILPLFLEKHFTAYDRSYFGSFSYSTNFLNPLQLIQLQSIPWDFKPPVLGIGLTVGLIISIIVLIFNKSINKKSRFVIYYSFLVVLLSIFLISEYSRSIWENLWIFKNLQFPWRFLMTATIFSVIVTAFSLNYIKNNLIRSILTLFIITPVFLINYSYLRPVSYNYIYKYYAEDSCRSTTWNNEYLPTWSRVCLPKSKNGEIYRAFPIVKATGTIKELKVSDNNRKVEFRLEGKAEKILIGNYYFPGWVVRVNNSEVKTKPYGKYGIMSFAVPDGNKKISAVFLNTWAREFSNIITFVTFILVLMAILIFVYKKNENRN